MDDSYNRVEFLEYFIKDSPTSDTISFTNEFTLASQNPNMCPVLYYYSKDSVTHSESDQALLSFDTSTSSFFVQTDNTAMLLANEMGQEVYTITGVTDAFSKAMPLTIFFVGCDSAYLIAVQDFKIISPMA